MLHIYLRMCDLLECQKSNPLRKVFHGCRHSFHIQCLLPNISDCAHCHSLLMAQVEVLGKAVNDSVSVKKLTENDEDSDQEDMTSMKTMIPNEIDFLAFWNLSGRCCYARNPRLQGEICESIQDNSTGSMPFQYAILLAKTQ